MPVARNGIESVSRGLVDLVASPLVKKQLGPVTLLRRRPWPCRTYLNQANCFRPGQQGRDVAVQFTRCSSTLPASPKPTPEATHEASHSSPKSPSKESVAKEQEGEQDDLPSTSHSRRSDQSKRFQAFMDDMLAKAALAGQKLNTYTGTDYTGIENIRRQIIELERKVKSLHEKVAAAKEAYTTAHAAQTSAQKEVVSLLERKSSWTPQDLDRYTSLIRSEHLHDVSVTEARQKLGQAERDLEETRNELEKRERRQYHEEQVWSDTIRRNSTWVTFGLMGLNILLLVANIGIVEPWRRRRLVKEVKDALDQKTLMMPSERQPSAAAQAINSIIDPTATVPTGDVEERIDEDTSPDKFAPTLAQHRSSATEGFAIAVEPSATTSAAHEAAVPQSRRDRLVSTLQSTWMRARRVHGLWSTGPFSDEKLQLSKVEVTSVALEGAAIGFAATALVSWLLRSGG